MKNELGSIFGRLTVISDMSSSKGKARWMCQCSCGKITVTTGDALRRGVVKSCGCLQAEARHLNTRKHGHGSYVAGVSRTYKSWQEMRARCNNKRSISYPNYGGRGISICARWSEFENFLADMGERPEGKSLDRIENNGNYEPNNCRWATSKEQNNKRRQCRYIEYLGRIQTIAQWCDELGLNYPRTYNRIVVQQLLPEQAFDIIPRVPGVQEQT